MIRDKYKTWDLNLFLPLDPFWSISVKKFLVNLFSRTPRAATKHRRRLNLFTSKKIREQSDFSGIE